MSLVSSPVFRCFNYKREQAALVLNNPSYTLSHMKHQYAMQRLNWVKTFIHAGRILIRKYCGSWYVHVSDLDFRRENPCSCSQIHCSCQQIQRGSVNCIILLTVFGLAAALYCAAGERGLLKTMAHSVSKDPNL